MEHDGSVCACDHYVYPEYLGEEEGERHPSIVKAQRTIAATRGLSPHAYIVHLDGGEVQGGATPEVFLKWQKQSSLALDMLAEMGGGASMLAVENLEHYPKGFWEQALDGMPGSRCVDIGHLWLDGFDALPYMQHTGRLTRVIHLHGSDLRDHASLEYVEAIKLDAVMEYLIQTGYGGVVTLEVFSQADFLSSCQSVERSLRRIGYL